jgi:hypothetical protein
MVVGVAALLPDCAPRGLTNNSNAREYGAL